MYPSPGGGQHLARRPACRPAVIPGLHSAPPTCTYALQSAMHRPPVPCASASASSVCFNGSEWPRHTGTWGKDASMRGVVRGLDVQWVEGTSGVPRSGLSAVSSIAGRGDYPASMIGVQRGACPTGRSWPSPTNPIPYAPPRLPSTCSAASCPCRLQGGVNRKARGCETREKERF